VRKIHGASSVNQETQDRPARRKAEAERSQAKRAPAMENSNLAQKARAGRRD